MSAGAATTRPEPAQSPVGYTAAQASPADRMHRGPAQSWERIGLVVPRDADGRSPYTFRDLVALRVVDRRCSMPGSRWPASARAVAVPRGVGRRRRRAALVTDGDSVWACRDDGQILDALRHGQLALFVAVDRIAAEVEAEVHAFDAERRSSSTG